MNSIDSEYQRFINIAHENGWDDKTYIRFRLEKEKIEYMKRKMEWIKEIEGAITGGFQYLVRTIKEISSPIF